PDQQVAGRLNSGVRLPMKLCLTVLLSFLLLGCVSSGDDHQVAAQVGQVLAATGVVPHDTREADRTHNGRIVYVGPGVNGNPHFTYYQVTSVREMQLLESAAQTALRRVPAANSVTLHFMERQVFRSGGSRGEEKEVRKIVIRR